MATASPNTSDSSRFIPPVVASNLTAAIIHS